MHRLPTRLLWLGSILFLAGCSEESSRLPVMDESPPSEVSRDESASSERPRFEFIPSSRGTRGSESGTSPDDLPHLKFVDAALNVGIDFVYDNGTSYKQLMVEATGGGCGWTDFDRDGQVDLYVVQGGIPDAEDPPSRPRNVLYRQLTADRFHEVAGLAQVDDFGYGQGVAIADFNHDGFDDIYVTNVGRNVLYLNLGDGTFEDATEATGTGGNVWSATAAWGDLNRDGHLDLYVCNYTIYDPYHPRPCRDEAGNPTICHPRHVDPEPDICYRNLGDGTFQDVTQELGLTGPGNKALGVVIADLNNDAWPDIFVANDTTANFFFVNESQGLKFRESAFLLGGAFSGTGETQASMGIAFGDYDGNGLPDLCLTHFTGESNTLYQNQGPAGLQDVSSVTSLRSLSLSKLGFGAVFQDFNDDGRLELLVANGHIDPQNVDGDGYEMRTQLLSYVNSRWLDVGPTAGPYFDELRVGRGVAMADFDRDGRMDVAIVHQNSRLALLHNQSDCQHGLHVRMIGIESARSGIGAQVTVEYGEQRKVMELAGGTSYASSQEPLLHFGVGDHAGPLRVLIRWPSGQEDVIPLDRPDVNLTVIEGRRSLIEPFPFRSTDISEPL